MGLNRIVTLFHSKLNTLGDTASVISAGTESGINSASASGHDSGSERNEDFDSSTTMSLSSSVESLARSSSPASGIVTTPPGQVPGQVFDYASEQRRRMRSDVMNNSNHCGSNTSLDVVPLKEVLNGKGADECNNGESFEDVLLVLGSAKGGQAVVSPCPIKRSSVLSRRFSLKAKFSSDLDLYGGGNRGNTMQDSVSSSSLLLQQQGRLHPKKPSIWSSFRLPIRMMKGNEGDIGNIWQGIVVVSLWREDECVCWGRTGICVN